MNPSIQLSRYRILFDRQAQGYRASCATCVYRAGHLAMAFLHASDGFRGQQTHLTRSSDLGETWDDPVLFGPEVADPANANQSVGLRLISSQGTELASGYHIPKGARPDHPEDIRWRPAHVLIGRREIGDVEFHWDRYPIGTFLTEGFAGGGLVTRSGRILLTIWGSDRRGSNWQCGVLLSDDDGRQWRYRRVGFESDPAIRVDPEMPAGYNEQSLFELADGSLVSIIRGREKLGAVAADKLDETYFFRSVSTDGGESWSAPTVTNLPGTGASSTGLVLPDDSLVLPARICKHAECT